MVDWIETQQEKSSEDAFQLIWTQLPEKQQRHSSSWWFFLLLPKQKEGFGPKQMMVTLVARAGQELTLGKTRFKGLDLRRRIQKGLDEFNAMTVGWIYDGQQMHTELVHEPAVATVSEQDCSVSAWSRQPDGTLYGSEMRAAPDLPYGVAVDFAGPKGNGRFKAWSADSQNRMQSPLETVNIDTPFGGSHVIAWPQLHFAGEFSSPSGTEYQEGVGYFQRVCLNFPPFPWKWIWATFADESVFAAFVPYIGFNFLRRHDWFFPKTLEKWSIPIKQSAYLRQTNPQNYTEFDQTIITPLVQEKGKYPHFQVMCRAKNGDFFQFHITPHTHAQFKLHKPILGGLFNSVFNYNEYLYRIQDMNGRIGGKPIQDMGTGFGNIEYTWGFGV